MYPASPCKRIHATLQCAAPCYMWFTSRIGPQVTQSRVGKAVRRILVPYTGFAFAVASPLQGNKPPPPLLSGQLPPSCTLIHIASFPGLSVRQEPKHKLLSSGKPLSGKHPNLTTLCMLLVDHGSIPCSSLLETVRFPQQAIFLLQIHTPGIATKWGWGSAYQVQTRFSLLHFRMYGPGMNLIAHRLVTLGIAKLFSFPDKPVS